MEKVNKNLVPITHTMRKVTFISKPDLQELYTIYSIASKTSLITNGIFNPKNADVSWNRVEEFLKKLADKYGYDWNQCKIIPDGTVVTITKRQAARRSKSLKDEFSRWK